MSRAATPADVIAGAARYAVAHGDCRAALAQIPDGIAQTCVTSPPYYGLRDYGCDGQIGLEQTPAEYVAQIVAVMREVRRVLRDDGTAWLNLGDSYAGSWGAQSRGDKHGSPVSASQIDAGPKRTRTGSIPAGSNVKPKDLHGIPWRVAFALQDDGWWLRSDIVWSKPNPMPESVTDRPTRAHEYVFLLTKSARYFYDADAVRDRASGRSSGNAAPDKSGNAPGFEIRAGFHKVGDVEWHERNARSVWTITPEPCAGAHFATMPPELARRCILAGSRRGDVVLDPFMGSGTTALAAHQAGRRYVGYDTSEEYVALAQKRLQETEFL